MTLHALALRALAAACLLLPGAAAVASGPGAATPTLAPPAAAASRPAAVGSAKLLRDLAYGSHARQKLDVYLPARPSGPVLLMVHGGAWAFGDKAQPAMIQPKAAYWNAQGYVVVSTNYRLLPQARPLEQADDVARALAFVQREAAGWGADARQVVLMGHSAGAHLVALLNANPALATQQGAQPWRATVSLDSAALDLVALMEAPHPRLYDRAFGSDPAYWKAASPQHVLADKVPPVLFLCARQRGDACAQAEAYERKAALRKHQVTIWMQDMSHGEINQRLGPPGPYTDSVARWISSIL